jgi:diguanylate cyclase (GGDEF)-like protein
MPEITQEAILTIILIAIVANLIVAVALLVSPRIRARRGGTDRSAEIDRQELLRAHLFGGATASQRPAPAASGRFDPVADAKVYVADMAADDRPAVEISPDGAADLATDGAADLATNFATDGAAGLDSGGAGEPALVGPAAEPRDGDAGRDGNPRALVDGVTPDLSEAASADPVTGFDGPATWSKRLSEENSRVQRYGRSATIVFVELAGLDRLAERLGPAAADRLIPPIATTMRRHARAADSLARLGPTRFAALLPDTDEVRAINYVERIRSACDVWLEAGAVSLRLSMGWAEMSPNQPVDPAIQVAERRLNVERGRLRGQESRDADDDRDVMAAQMRPARAN